MKDGLFIGDELAAQDLEFVVSNKVTRVINCCAHQVPNHWEPIGVVYLPYFWDDDDKQIILDNRDVTANKIFHFIEEALQNAESVLVHSIRGQSRSCCVLSAYMMNKYCWGLRKTMEFLSSRRPDLNLKPAFLQQLSGYERRLMVVSKQKFSLDWSDSELDRPRPLESEELLLKNTYINSQMGPLAEFPCNGGFQDPSLRQKLFWADSGADDKLRLEKPPGSDRVLKRNHAGQPILKSIIKVNQYFRSRQENLDSNVSSESQAVLSTKPQEVGFDNRSRGQPPNKPAVTSAWAEPHPEDNGNSTEEYVTRGFSGSEHKPAPKSGSQGYSTAGEWRGPDPGGVGLDKSPAGSDVWAKSRNAPVPNGGPSLIPNYPGVTGAPRGQTAGPRDSLLGMRRGDSPEPRDLVNNQNRSASASRARDQRDSSARSSQVRAESPITSIRGESPPLQLLNRSNRPGTSGAGRSASANPTSLGNFNFSGVGLGGVRPSIPNGAQPSTGSQRGSTSGMGAFHSGGPVKAKADIFGVSDGTPMRRNRPATASAQRGGSGSRPASPLGGGRSSTSSRPASPQTRRQSSPSRQSVTQTTTQAPHFPSDISAHQMKQRSLSSHMRRAPSPTPAFNRNPSPGKPRWRT